MGNLHVIPSIKSFMQGLPKPFGYLLSKVPYNSRPWMGAEYSSFQKRVSTFEQLGAEEKKKLIFNRVKKTLSKATGIPFYRDLYSAHAVVLDNIKKFEDISKLPIVTKEMLKKVPIEERSALVKGRYVANTGGSTGSPLNFYITPRLIPKEWAHMHNIWAKLGYDQSMLKMGFGGRNLGKKNVVYDGLRHQYAINVYKKFEQVAPEIRDILKKEKVYYLHGYPSAISEFSTNCEKYAPDLITCLRQTLRGVFLGSEYPTQLYRDRIESTFGVPTVSWYGHTERAVLAWEKSDEYVYYPFQTYGYCEVVPNQETGGWRLIGTSYDNYCSPFVRYDTGDDVEPVEVLDGLVVSFRIRSGREGDFVIDRQGAKIPLTALIFGRHHRLFNIASFVQVRQVAPGKATIIVTPKETLPSDFVFGEWFDSSDTDMEISFQVVKKPILSASGKVVLKVSSECSE
jgi:phenylacetate-CoA ligase